MNILGRFRDFITAPGTILSISFICTVVSFLLGAITFVDMYSSIFSRLMVSLSWTPYAAIIFMIVPVGAFWYDNSRLRRRINGGLKMIRNDAKVVVDTERKKYNISIEKEFSIISDDIDQWYDAQFYCNVKPDDANEAIKYYHEHAPEWRDLNVYAFMRFKNPKESAYSDELRLKVKPITNKSFLIPFHIYYSGMNNESGVVQLKKGSKVVLRYGYDVSAELWGSYLNRSLSFFGEKATCVLKLPNIGDKRVDVSLCEHVKQNKDPIMLNIKADIKKVVVSIPMNLNYLERVEESIGYGGIVCH